MVALPGVGQGGGEDPSPSLEPSGRTGAFERRRTLMGVQAIGKPDHHATQAEVNQRLGFHRVMHDLLGVHVNAFEKIPDFRRRVLEFIYSPKSELVIATLIILSVLTLTFEVSMLDERSIIDGQDNPAGTLGWFFFTFDVSLSFIFLVEYLVKLWIAPRKWYFVRTNLVDFFALLPILRVFRIGQILRPLRLLRLLRLIRVSTILQQRVRGASNSRDRQNAETLIVISYLIFSLVFGSVGVLVFEKGYNPDFNGLGDGMWWCVVTLTTVGYGDISPTTTGGKLVATVIMFIGLSFYALLTGILSSVIIERSKEFSITTSMKISNLTDHIIVCGWNETGRRLVLDLIESGQHPKVLVVHPNRDIPRINSPRLYYLFEDPTTAIGLELARVEHATVAVVLSNTQGDGRSVQDIDARTILTVLAIERTNPEIHTIAELQNSENVFHMRNTGCDEIIVSGSYTGAMISQAAQNPGISDVFDDLFTPGEGSSLQQRPLPERFVGRTFSDVSQEIFIERAGVLIGYRRGMTRPIISPPSDLAMKRGDIIILIQHIGHHRLAG